MLLTNKNYHNKFLKKGLFSSMGIMALAFGIIALGSIFCLTASSSLYSRFATFVLMCFVIFSGLVLCNRTQIQLADPLLRRLNFFWLLKVFFTFLILYIGWIPNLEYYIAHDRGYDPIRYYWQAKDLIDSGWVANFVSLNYTGILYIYGVIFFLFGHNPFAPALINVFITLVATLFLVRTCYRIKPYRSRHDWTIGLALLIPEILWFDVMTSRETLTGSLLLIAMLAAGRYFTQLYSLSLFKTILVVGICGFFVAAIRTSMIIPLTISVFLMIFVIKTKNRYNILSKNIYLLFLFFMVFISPYLNTVLGGYDFDYFSVIHKRIFVSNSILSLEGWSENSIGLLLIPKNFLEYVLYLFPRMILYIVNPIINFSGLLNGLIQGNYASWQNFLQGSTSLINIVIFPYAIASFIHTLRFKYKVQSHFVIHISYWITFASIAGGNLIIHPRYRIMATLLLVGCGWLGYQTCDKKTIHFAVFSWYSFIFFGFLSYVFYKFI